MILNTAEQCRTHLQDLIEHMDERHMALIDFDDIKTRLAETCRLLAQTESLTDERDRLRSDLQDRIAGMVKAIAAVDRQQDRSCDALDLLATLSEQQRAAVVLRYAGGFTPTEIADLLGTSAGTIRVQLHRAHAHLRDRIDER